MQTFSDMDVAVEPPGMDSRRVCIKSSGKLTLRVEITVKFRENLAEANTTTP